MESILILIEHRHRRKYISYNISYVTYGTILNAKREQAGEHLGLPGKQKIAELPDIEWEKYRVVAADEAVRPRPDTRYAGTPSSSSNHSSTRVVDGQVCKYNYPRPPPKSHFLS